MVPAVMGLLIGTRTALVANVLVPAGMVAGLVLSPHPLLGTLFMTVLAAVVGASSRLGWHGVGASLGPWVALALIDPPAVRLAQETVPAAHSPQSAMVLAGLALAGGLWATAIGRLLCFPTETGRHRGRRLLRRRARRAGRRDDVPLHDGAARCQRLVDDSDPVRRGPTRLRRLPRPRLGTDRRDARRGRYRRRARGPAGLPRPAHHRDRRGAVGDGNRGLPDPPVLDLRAAPHPGGDPAVGPGSGDDPRRRSAARCSPSAPAWPRPSCWSSDTGSSPPVAVPDRHPGKRQRYPPRVLCGGVRLVRGSILLRSTCGGT